MPTFQNAYISKIRMDLMRRRGKDMLLGDPAGIPTPGGISLRWVPSLGKREPRKDSLVSPIP